MAEGKSTEAPTYWPVDPGQYRTIRMTLEPEAGNALFGAMLDYFRDGTEPTMGDPSSEDDSTYGLDVPGRLLFEYFRPKLDADRAAVMAGTYDGDALLWWRL